MLGVKPPASPVIFVQIKWPLLEMKIIMRLSNIAARLKQRSTRRSQCLGALLVGTFSGPERTWVLSVGISYLKLNPEALSRECWREGRHRGKEKRKNDEKGKENVQRKNNASL